MAAIITMSKAPVPGKTKTRLCPPLSPTDAADLYAALLGDTLDLITSLTEITPVVAVTPPEGIHYFHTLPYSNLHVWPVDGDDIGVCLEGALNKALASGHNFAIAINSDGPTLPAKYLSEAIQYLENGVDVVFGPNFDGGFYLIGLSAPHPRLLLNGDETLPNIAWSTEDVLGQILTRADSLGLRTQLLPAHADVDLISDLERLAAELDTLPAEFCRHTREWMAHAFVPVEEELL